MHIALTDIDDKDGKDETKMTIDKDWILGTKSPYGLYALTDIDDKDDKEDKDDKDDQDDKDGKDETKMTIDKDLIFRD